jgi:potassium-transporting ATPase KdpC subunit
MHDIIKELKTSVLLFLAFSLVTGLIYPLLITGIVQITMPNQAQGSLIEAGGRVIGSELIGQYFTSPQYFHGRPSAVGYATNGSGGSNLGPTSSRLMDVVHGRIKQLRNENNLSQNDSVPAELALASASGLDPHISKEGAMLQVPRIAKARGLPESEVKLLVYQIIEPAQFGILGQERVNVLKLNIALDDLAGRR